jgi:hypothetical protein
MYFVVILPSDCHATYLVEKSALIKTGLNMGGESLDHNGRLKKYTLIHFEYLQNNYYSNASLRIAIIPNDGKIKKQMYNIWATDKIILSESYFLYDINTIKKFNLKITSNYVIQVCKIGNIEILEYLKNMNLLVNNYQTILDLDWNWNTNLNFNSNDADNYLKILNWWAKSGLPLQYTEAALHNASMHNNINVLDWWIKSDYPLKYDENAMDLASLYGNVDVLEWWIKSGLELKYSKKALDGASRYDHVNVLTWWKNSGLPLKYSTDALDLASNDTIVLEWWKNSGLELKYTDYLLNRASILGYIKVLDWWKNSGLPLKYSEIVLNMATEYFYDADYKNIVEWWNKSGLLPPVKITIRT